MVEMREAAHIVTAATSKSLLLIDEIGRGTATTDGLAIAQAIIEWIVQRLKCRTLFATHFHELTALEAECDAVQNLSVEVIDDGQDVIFTHRIRRGPASKSYGLEVAKLAGLPEELLDRAAEIMAAARSESVVSDCQAGRQLQLFAAPALRSKTGDEEGRDLIRQDPLREELGALCLDHMTPIQALNNLERLQTKFCRRSGG